MSSADIKEVVKEKYGQAALRVTSGGSSCCGATTSSGWVRSDHVQPLRRSQADRFPKRRCSRRSAAAIRPRWRN